MHKILIIGFAIVLLLLCSCGGGDGDYIADTSNSNAPGLDNPSGSIVALHLSSGLLENNIGFASPHSSNTLECVLISAANGINISTTDAVAEDGFQSTTDTTNNLNSAMYLMEYELSQAQWNNLVNASGAGSQYLDPWDAVSANSASDFGTPADDLPAWGLSKDDIDSVLSAYNSNNYFQLRLPTDIEWEHACRATSDTRYSWGDTMDGLDYAYVTETTVVLGPRTVDDGTANAFNLFNMHGNLWEWTSDGNLRGGSWGDSIISAASGNIMAMDSDIAYALAGVRLVIEAP